MTPEQIKEKVGQPVTEAEMVDMLKTNPIGTSDRDVMVRSGVLRFSFGPRGGETDWRGSSQPAAR